MRRRGVEPRRRLRRRGRVRRRPKSARRASFHGLGDSFAQPDQLNSRSAQFPRLGRFPASPTGAAKAEFLTCWRSEIPRTTTRWPEESEGGRAIRPQRGPQGSFRGGFAAHAPARVTVEPFEVALAAAPRLRRRQRSGRRRLDRRHMTKQMLADAQLIVGELAGQRTGPRRRHPPTPGCQCPRQVAANVLRLEVEDRGSGGSSRGRRRICTTAAASAEHGEVLSRRWASTATSARACRRDRLPAAG